jgi:hypothetical protein
VAEGEGPGGNRVARWLWPRQNNSNPAFNHPSIQIHVRCIRVGALPCAWNSQIIYSEGTDNKNYNGGKIFILCRMNGTTLYLR